MELHIAYYESALRGQNQTMQSSRRDFENPSVVARIFASGSDLPTRIRKATSELINHSFSAKGLITMVKEHEDKLRGKDLSTIITNVEKLIQSSIDYKSSVENFINNQQTRTYHNEACLMNEVFDDIIDSLYQAQRTLKRLTNKKPIETSEYAKAASKVSLNTLQRIHYGH